MPAQAPVLLFGQILSHLLSITDQASLTGIPLPLPVSLNCRGGMLFSDVSFHSFHSSSEDLLENHTFYAFIHPDSQFPIDITPVKKDHDFLEKDLVEPLCR